MHRSLFLFALGALLAGCSGKESEKAEAPILETGAAPSMESRPLRRSVTPPDATFQDNALIGGGAPADDPLAPPPPVASSGDGDPFKVLPASVDKTPIRTDGIGLSPGAASPDNP
jgi:endonuclease YncB( thermonuclease family)